MLIYKVISCVLSIMLLKIKIESLKNMALTKLYTYPKILILSTCKLYSSIHSPCSLNGCHIRLIDKERWELVSGDCDGGNAGSTLLLGTVITGPQTNLQTEAKNMFRQVNHKMCHAKQVEYFRKGY